MFTQIFPQKGEVELHIIKKKWWLYSSLWNGELLKVNVAYLSKCYSVKGHYGGFYTLNIERGNICMKHGLST